MKKVLSVAIIALFVSFVGCNVSKKEAVEPVVTMQSSADSMSYVMASRKD